MMATDEEGVFDVVIVGSGPAGVSAAFPLLQAGRRVLLVDGGKQARTQPPSERFLQARAVDPRQWEWMIGRDFHALRRLDAVSPKLRLPTHAQVFEDFGVSNQIVSDSFVAVGSLAAGGLSNAWGCGVASLSGEELADFPAIAADMRVSYESVTSRIGVSGAAEDDLRDFFGLDDWAQPALPIDALQGAMLDRYARARGSLRAAGLRLGRARTAALSLPVGDRQPCDLSGNCLWGCSRRALYSAREDLRALRAFPNFQYRPGFVVGSVFWEGGLGCVRGLGSSDTVRARRVLLAAGTLASTRLALQALGHRAPVPMQSCPTAAFLLWLPRQLGRSHQDAFGLAQLAFALETPGAGVAYGGLFNTTGIPVAEFARFAPLGRRAALDVLQALLPSCVVGNVFLRGDLMDARLTLDAREQLLVEGDFRGEVGEIMQGVRRRLAAGFRKLGAIMLPGSFQLGRPGADIHYAASLPMRHRPSAAQTDTLGALSGTQGIHVVDGACLPFLPAKPHTLTIMANADRIGRKLAALKA